MSLEITLAVLVPLVILFGVCVYLDNRKLPLGEVKLIPYKAISFITLIMIIILAAHLLTFLKGGGF